MGVILCLCFRSPNSFDSGALRSLCKEEVVCVCCSKSLLLLGKPSVLDEISRKSLKSVVDDIWQRNIVRILILQLSPEHLQQRNLHSFLITPLPFSASFRPRMVTLS